jgi:hypothetical protein
MGNSTTRPFYFFLLLACALLAFTPTAAADDPEARSIMQKVEDRDDGDNQISNMTMILIDKRGNERIRKIKSFGKDKGADEQRLMFFMEPADVKDTGFLTYDYDDTSKDDDQWLYLPALRKTKRIAAGDKSGSFMGSDLNYSDMTSRDLEDFDFEFYKTREQEINGVKTWVIEAVPRSKEVIEETGYRKSILWIRQDNYVLTRSFREEDKKGYYKYVTVEKLEQIDGIWVASEMHIKRTKGKETVHRTVLKLDDVKFNQDLDETMFSIRRLEKGL